MTLGCLISSLVESAVSVLMSISILTLCTGFMSRISSWKISRSPCFELAKNTSVVLSSPVGMLQNGEGSIRLRFDAGVGVAVGVLAFGVIDFSRFRLFFCSCFLCSSCCFRARRGSNVVPSIVNTNLILFWHNDFKNVNTRSASFASWNGMSSSSSLKIKVFES